MVSTSRFIRNGYIDWKLGVPSVFLALIGAHFGTRLQLAVDEKYLKAMLLVVLPFVAFAVLRQHSFPEERGEIEEKKQLSIVLSASLLIGMYDGFYGPGTGTFLLLVFCNLAKLDLRTASGNVKLVNLSSNIGALITSLLNGKVFIALGLIAAVASVAGHYLGSGLVLKDGSKIVRPAVITVIILLTIKVLTELY